MPDPAREALDEPHLGAKDLEQEIGGSEEWDEASQDDEDAEDSGREEP
jgi:hypothetical protein